MRRLQSSPRRRMTAAAKARSRRAAFIDRDGVINEERDYVHRVEDFVLLPGVIDAFRLLRSAGFDIVVVTNQAGIARGMYSESQYRVLEAHLHGMAAAAGAPITATYFCPHHPSAGVGDLRADCDCRKPHPGMLLRAAADFGFALADSVLVGDKGSDIEAGRAAGLAHCVLVTSGHAVSAADAQLADACAPGLLEAARWVISKTAA